jgi:hypothetical protein
VFDHPEGHGPDFSDRHTGVTTIAHNAVTMLMLRVVRFNQCGRCVAAKTAGYLLGIALAYNRHDQAAQHALVKAVVDMAWEESEHIDASAEAAGQTRQ